MTPHPELGEIKGCAMATKNSSIDPLLYQDSLALLKRRRSHRRGPLIEASSHQEHDLFFFFKPHGKASVSFQSVLL